MVTPTPESSSEVPSPLSSIPLSAEVSPNGSPSIGGLVREATTYVSTLIRAEVELAKLELTAEVKKGVKGSVFFVIALSILVFSLFFFFIFLAQLLSIWLQSWASYLIVFGIMVVAAGFFALLGYQRVRKLHAPEKTISTVKDTAAVLGRRGRDDPHQPRP